jgi:two-component system, NarL family, sensor kinase
VQESLTNVLRHAGARHVRVELLGDAQSLRLKVIDDGCGFDTSRVATQHLGLSGIRERIELHGRHLAGGGAAVERQRVAAPPPAG